MGARRWWPLGRDARTTEEAQKAPPARRPAAELWRVLGALPTRVAVGVVLVLVSTLLPSVLLVLAYIGALEGMPPLAFLGEHQAAAWAVAVALAVVVVLVVEPPRAGSPVAYMRRLRERATEVRTQYLAASGRQDTTQDDR